MMQPQKIAFIGGGKMGEAIFAGLLSSQEGPAAALTVHSFAIANPGLPRREYLQKTYGVTCVANASELDAADVVFIAVKPQVLPGILEGLRASRLFAGNPLFVSIAAGITTKTLMNLLPAGARVVRTMPNTPLLIGRGMTAVVGDSGAAGEDVELVRQLFACLGSAAVVPEVDMDAVCAVSGSGPAYVAAMVEALRDGGVAEGLSSELAEQLALQTVLGTACLIAETGQAPEDVRKAVCSPGGTTLAALDAMYAAGFTSVFAKGVSAAKKRSIELGAS